MFATKQSSNILFSLHGCKLIIFFYSVQEVEDGPECCIVVA